MAVAWHAHAENAASIKKVVVDFMRLVLLGLRSEEHTSELQSRPHLVCRLLLEKKKREQLVPPCVRELVAAHGRGRYEGPAGVRFVLVDGIAAGLGERKRRGRRIELRVRLARLA